MEAVSSLRACMLIGAVFPNLLVSSLLCSVTHLTPDNFGTGNSYYLVEFLKYVATLAPVSLTNVFLACIGTQQEDGRVVNGLNVVCAQDICLCDGDWPVDDNQYTHLMRFLYRMAYGILYRRVTGNNLSRNFTSDSHHVVAYQHEFQQSSFNLPQQSSSSVRQQSSSRIPQQSSSRHPCDHPACGAVFNSATEYKAHVAQHQQKVDKPFFARRRIVTRLTSTNGIQLVIGMKSTIQTKNQWRKLLQVPTVIRSRPLVAHFLPQKIKLLSFQTQSTPSWQLVQSMTSVSRLLISKLLVAPLNAELKVLKQLCLLTGMVLTPADVKNKGSMLKVVEAKLRFQQLDKFGLGKNNIYGKVSVFEFYPRNQIDDLEDLQKQSAVFNGLIFGQEKLSLKYALQVKPFINYHKFHFYHTHFIIASFLVGQVAAQLRFVTDADY
ncbi:hypothetical protein MIR68_003886 [Amoeboaphelidium protococcarum]|nr:hypothetical protein MIR68_003886 [Amoeboaphelidium protococcarum]